MANARLMVSMSADGARSIQRAVGNVGHMDHYDTEANTPLSAKRGMRALQMLHPAMILLDDQQEEEAVQVEVDGISLPAKEGGDQEEVAMEGMTTESGTVLREETGKGRVDGQAETSLLGTTIAIQATGEEST